MHSNNNKPIQKLVIAGGGTAGWMAAAALSHLVGRPLDITLIESDAIGTVGVGEATIPTILEMNRLLGIPEPELIRETSATFKLGIQFENWKRPGEQYFHSFGDTGKGCWACGFHHFWVRARQENLAGDYGEYCPEVKAAAAGKFGIMSDPRLNYAYHMDATRYGQYLRKLSERRGVTRVEGRIDHIELDNDTGDISHLRLEDGQVIEGDLFIDCTGFRAMLIEGALKAGFDDWSNYLPSNRALAVQSELEGSPVPFTRAIAHKGGWQWRIPLQHRAGNGIVYNSEAYSDDEALATLLGNIPEKTITDPRPIRFTTGQRKRYWHRNCVAIGLSSGFIEPLESTSIHFIQNGIMWLLLMFPENGVLDSLRDEYNAQLRKEAEHIRDFIVLHYHLNEREGDPYWDHLRNMPIPDTLAQRMALFNDSGRVFKPQDDVFAENSWVQVMMGQGLRPSAYHNVVDSLSREQLITLMQQASQHANAGLAKVPNHGEFVAHYARQ